MLEINGQPMLDIWLDAFNEAGVDEVLINLHYLPEVVSDHVSKRVGPPIVRTFYEPELLGSAGTLLANRHWVRDDDFFLACYADNLTDFDLRLLVNRQRDGGADATLGLFYADNPSACGIVELDSEGRMVGFVEKPEKPVSNLANAGMYAFRPSVLDELEGQTPMDIGYHLLPRLIGRAQAVTVDGYLRDIGTVASYRTAQQEWAERAPR
jgi:mannose-1-phosphate guanylyltransferase